MTSSTVTCPQCSTRNRLPPAASGTPRCATCKAALPWVVAATEDNFPEVGSASVPVLVDFWAAWCGPCRVVGPAVESLAATMAGRLKAVKVDVDQAPRLAARYGVQSIPTLILLRSGQELARQVGALPAPALESWLRSHLAVPGA